MSRCALAVRCGRDGLLPGYELLIGAIPYKTIPNKISIDMIIICRPVVLEIVEKGRPVRQQMMNLEIT